MVARRYWHYTVFERFQSIVSDGMITTADTLVSREVKRVVWFSTNPCWEKTVVKIVLNNETGMKTELRSRDELFNFGFFGDKKEVPHNKVNDFTPIRLEADPEKVHLRSFQNYKKRSGDSKSVIQGLVQTAKEWGANPKEWYVVYENVPLSNISLIQRWNSEEWISMMKGY